LPTINPLVMKRKMQFLRRFSKGFKKLEVGRKRRARYIAEWAIINDLLIRGQIGYYKITEKGLVWLSLANELNNVNAFNKVDQLIKMAPDSHLKSKRKHKPRKRVSPNCNSKRPCVLIKT